MYCILPPTRQLSPTHPSAHPPPTHPHCLPLLQGVRYGVFGLGNKQYEHFNAVGKKLHAGLLALGATPLVRRGDGDDDGCIDDDYDKWCLDLHLGIDSSDVLGHQAATGAASADSADAVPTYDVTLASPGACEVLPFPQSGSGTHASTPFWASVKAVRELHTAQSSRSCVHVELDLSAGGPAYETGDHVAIYSQNQPSVVNEVAALLGVAPGTLFTLGVPNGAAGGVDQSMDTTPQEDGSLAEPWAGPLSLRAALGYFADVLSPPHREALAALAACATDTGEKKRLARMASPAGRQDYQDYIHKPQRSLLEVRWFCGWVWGQGVWGGGQVFYKGSKSV